MRVLLAALILLSGAAHAASTEYWVCVDEKGRKTAQDHPCPPSGARVDAQQPKAQVPDSSPQKKSARPPKQQAPDFSSIFKVAWKAAAWILLALAVVAAFKIAPAVIAKSRRPRDTTVPDRIPFIADPGIPALRLAHGPAIKDWSLALIRELEWKRFEELCCEVWKARGYEAEMTSLGEDGGVDVIVRDSRHASPLAVIQCKSWSSSPVGVEPVRALWGAKDHFQADRAVIYGLSGFSESAQRFAKDKALDLYTGQDLLEQVRALSVPEQRAILEHVTRGDYVTPTCPKCGQKMVLRVGDKGEAWGCPSFPRCRARMIPLR